VIQGSIPFVPAGRVDDLHVGDQRNLVAVSMPSGMAPDQMGALGNMLTQLAGAVPADAHMHEVPRHEDQAAAFNRPLTGADGHVGKAHVGDKIAPFSVDIRPPSQGGDGD